MKPYRYYYLSYFKRLPSAWLLLAQLVVLISLPLLNNSYEQQLISWILGTITLLMTGLIIRHSPVYTGLGVGLVGIALGLSALAFFTQRADWLAIAHIFEALAYFLAAYAMVLYMFKDDHVSRDELFAVASVFTLITWGFAFLYSTCQIWYPNSFTSSIQPTEPRTWLELLFLSFAVLSGVGMTDILPISPPARVLSALEMFGGVMYLTLVVSRLLGMVKGSGLKR